MIAALWSAISLWRGWGRIATGAGAAWRWITASNVHLLITLTAIIGAWGAWEHHCAASWQQAAGTARTALAGEKLARKTDRAEYDRQVKIAKAATVLAETKSREAASNADDFHDQLVQADDSLRSYIAAHRVRAVTPDRTDAAGPGEDHAAALPFEPAAGAIMASEADLVACDADYAYALSAWHWSQELIAKSLAVPEGK